MSQQRIRDLQTELRRLRKQERKKKGTRLGLPQRKGMGCRDRDEELKRQRGYTDPSSYVRKDGSEKLVGEDWQQRRRELYLRADGRCERISKLNKLHDPRCNTYGSEPHHVVKRSMRRDDRLSNLVNLSHWCHEAEDNRKPKWTKR